MLSALRLACFVVASLVMFAACRAGDERPARVEASLKGWELYSWSVDDGRTWRFALLEGTNRVKQFDEIRAGDSQLRGLETLLTELERLPPGEFIFWCAPRAPGQPATGNLFPLPPRRVVDKVVERAGELRLSLALP